MDSSDYEQKMKAIISDEITYKKLGFDPTEKYTKETRHELEVLKNNLEKKLNFMMNFSPEVVQNRKFMVCLRSTRTMLFALLYQIFIHRFLNKENGCQ
jgi:hypothetical protein